MTDSLRVLWKLPEVSDRLTMLVIVGTRSVEHSLRSHNHIFGGLTLKSYGNIVQPRKARHYAE